MAGECDFKWVKEDFLMRLHLNRHLTEGVGEGCDKISE